MNGPSARISAQAKINLHLRVLARESSGFHSIETIFHRVELADEVEVQVTNGERVIDVAGAELGAPGSNLAYRAAVSYSARAGWPVGFRIELTKHIPVGAGLGGGSADAAAVLRTLDMLSPNPMGAHTLMELASDLGSDVAFLTGDAAMALAWGHGERMMELPSLPSRDLLLMTPDFAVSTADAYRWLDEDLRDGSSPPCPAALALRPEDLSRWEDVARFARNDFEGPVSARYPEIADTLRDLRSGESSFAQMTGSGSTVYSLIDRGTESPIAGRSGFTTRHTTTAIAVATPVRLT